MSIIWLVKGTKEFDPGEYSEIFEWGFTDVTSAERTKRYCERIYPSARWETTVLRVDSYSELDITLGYLISQQQAEEI